MTYGFYIREVEMPDGTTKTDYATVAFQELRKDPSLPEARVASQIGYGLEYGRGKCSVTVSLACDQTAAMIDLAADLALHKADELADAGMQIVMKRLEEP